VRLKELVLSLKMGQCRLYEYADEDSSTYHEYQLTYKAVQDGDEEIETEIAAYTKITWHECNQVSAEDGNGNKHPIDLIECVHCR
jgi:hypothetical protein